MQTTAELPVININQSMKHMGMIMMTLAATVGMVELPEQHAKAVTAPQAIVFATETPDSSHTQRREREESGPHYVSYSAAMRTPGRTGRF